MLSHSIQTTANGQSNKIIKLKQKHQRKRREKGKHVKEVEVDKKVMIRKDKVVIK